MTARTVVATSSLALALVSSGCLKFYEIAVETPIQAKIDVSTFQRVLIAGFLTGGSRSLDPNTETARLLRSQLRSKSDMRVIDAEVLSIADEVDKRRGTPSPSPSAEAERFKTEKDLQAYEAIFTDTEYWKKIGAEFQNPLIITGSIMFTEVAKSGVASVPQTVVDPQGQARYSEQRVYRDLKGYALTPKFIFIDGKTGTQLYTESYNEERLYPTGQNVPSLSAYFEMMDGLLPSFLNTLSTQKIKGSRILLK
jgi:hypothetical protein